MTTPASPLAALADIQQPVLHNEWYKAPIWSLLAFVLLVLLGFAGWKLWQRRQQRRPLRLALVQLNALDLSAADAASQISSILKRVLRTLNPQHPALSYAGQPWQQFLQQSLNGQPSAQPPLPDLLALHYQPSPAAADIQAYAAFARHWLRSGRPQLISTVTVTPQQNGVADV